MPSTRLPRTWPEIIIHADMDAFYAAVEQLDNAELRGKPVLIGPNSHRGVVLTASYEARPYGVGSAMPVAEARRRCPHAIMVPPRFERYQEVSARVMQVLGDFSPAVEPLSLDEAFVDMSGAEHIFGPPQIMGAKIKAAVLEATGLHISVGVSGTKYVAKVASAHNKPDGLTVVPPATAKDWLAPLPVNRLWGVGKKTAPRLQALGLHTIGDIAALDARDLSAKLGVAGRHFHCLAHAHDPRRVERGRTAKSIGSDRTLNEDVVGDKAIQRHLRNAADRVARRLRQKNYVARGVRVRLKTSSFQSISRQCQLDATSSGDVLFRAACRLLREFDHPGPFRLVGLAAFGLDWQQQASQLDLFTNHRQRNLERTLDALMTRYGKGAVTRARDLKDAGTVARDGVNLDFLDYREGERVTRPHSGASGASGVSGLERGAGSP